MKFHVPPRTSLFFEGPVTCGTCKHFVPGAEPGSIGTCEFRDFRKWKAVHMWKPTHIKRKHKYSPYIGRNPMYPDAEQYCSKHEGKDHVASEV